MIGHMRWTDDPVRDAERYAFRLNNRPVIGECDVCGCELHREDDYFEADDTYLFETGDMVCANCLRKYCDEHFKI